LKHKYKKNKSNDGRYQGNNEIKKGKETREQRKEKKPGI